MRNRKSIRIKDFDYSQNGAYFISICTKNRENLFGDIIENKMILNKIGNTVNSCWYEIPMHYPNVKTDEFIIMPNHIHGILWLENPINSKQSKTNKYQHIIPRSLGSIVRGFKIGVTKWFRQNTDKNDIWQRNFYDIIIRDDEELNRIRTYIINNPLNWHLDENNKNISDIKKKPTGIAEHQ